MFAYGQSDLATQLHNKFLSIALHQAARQAQIDPGLGLVLRGAQKIGRVVAHHHRNTTITVYLATQFAQRQIGHFWHARLQQGLGSKTPQCQNDLGLQQFHLTMQKGLALLHLLRAGVAIGRRSALEHIGNVDRLLATGLTAQA